MMSQILNVQAREEKEVALSAIVDKNQPMADEYKKLTDEEKRKEEEADAKKKKSFDDTKEHAEELARKTGSMIKNVMNDASNGMEIHAP